MNTTFSSTTRPAAAPFSVSIAPLHTAQDLEDAFDAVSHAIQLTPGAISGFGCAMNLGAVDVYEFAVDRGIELRFSHCPDAIALGFLIEGDRIIEDARPWLRTQVWVAPESQVAFSSLRPCHVAFVRIAREQLAQPDREALDSLRSPFFAEAAAFAEVRTILDRLTRDQRSTQDALSRLRAVHAREELLRALLSSLRRVALVPRPESARESRSLDLVRSVEAYMWENVEEPLTLGRICRDMNCGVRALIYAFKDVYGVGPMTYWKSRRLNGAHRKLRESMGKMPILEIAADFGFWHMGHFSSDHKQMFGMTPSQAIEAGTAG